MKKVILGAVMMATMGQAIAQSLPQQFRQLPDLPPSSQLKSEFVGNHYLLGQGANVEPVVFAGFSNQGNAIAFSLTDVPEMKKSQKDAIQMCAAKGPGWKVPTIDEIVLLTPHVDDAVVSYLPGGYWTMTKAPCDDNCLQKDLFFITYNPLSGNQGNSYNFEQIFKFYPACAYQF